MASLLKIREKSLIDRFKGQIAWLELQKQKFKESGLTSEISMIKKKQRALLLRLNHDRKELHRVLKERQQQQQSDAMRNSSILNFNISHMSTNMSIRKTSISKQSDNTALGKRALKAIELPGGGAALETYVIFLSLPLSLLLYQYLHYFTLLWLQTVICSKIFYFLICIRLLNLAKVNLIKLIYGFIDFSLSLSLSFAVCYKNEKMNCAVGESMLKNY